ncbi:hypothetical protein PaG_04655 [Moesziomyces aphidis]|uniref:Protein kinase domain-containing protein n=1 Tax=Moesziomyces aphidis TaxID=84754 RepID=W3VGS0_MOEAP|nr:hypothetical protein PaG_04655 [Moesziomyces aphidis]
MASTSTRRLVGGTCTVDVTSGLVAHSDGLSSRIYRWPLVSSPSFPYARSPPSSSYIQGLEGLALAAERAGGVRGWTCIKRVHIDEEPRPHSVRRELALLSTLPAHENIVPLLSAFCDTTDPFGEFVDLIMPLYAATLEDVLQEPSLLRLPCQGSMERAGGSIRHLWEDSPAAFAHSVALQMLSGLAFLHGKEVAHRDVKPANVLIAHTGAVKLCDLGTAFSPSSAGEEEQKMVCQVGTGIFRAPELLFSPSQYDAYAVDVWATAVTLAHFHTPLIPTLTTPVAEVEVDERTPWQRAFDSNTEPPSPGSDQLVFWEEEPRMPQQSASGYIRTPLFEPDRGDIGLAASIFNLLGLPTDLKDWPEAEHFHPPLHRLPFTPTQATGIQSALPLATNPNPLVDSLIKPALHLSASHRPTAAQLLTSLPSPHTPAER